MSVAVLLLKDRLDDLSQVLVPINHSNNHWILCVSEEGNTHIRVCFSHNDCYWFMFILYTQIIDIKREVILCFDPLVQTINHEACRKIRFLIIPYNHFVHHNTYYAQ